MIMSTNAWEPSEQESVKKKEKTTNSHARFRFALLQGAGTAGDGVVADPRELDRWPPNFG